MGNMVPNELPTVKLPYSMAFIGEAPGEDEETVGRPFVGNSGNLLSNLMQAADISRSACLVGNICQVRPPHNNIKRFSENSWQIENGKARLRKDLETVQPNVVVLLGEAAIKAAGLRHLSTTEARGTLFVCNDPESPMFGFKCLASLHPAACLHAQRRNAAGGEEGDTPGSVSLLPLLLFDLKRGRKEANAPELELPVREYQLDYTPEELIRKMESHEFGVPLSIDIEGGVTQGVTCIAVAESPHTAYIIKVNELPDLHKAKVLRAFDKLMKDERIPKILQNQLYDNFVLSWSWGTFIANVQWDTMLSGWEIYPELPKNLGTLASIWTRQPAWKFQRKIHDSRTHYQYCCTDAMVTYEIALAHKEYFETYDPEGHAARHFQFNMEILNPILYMELKGIKYDVAGVEARKAEIAVEQGVLMSQIELGAGKPLNPNSPKQMVNTLYDTLGFEAQYTIERGRKTNKRTTDQKALLKLFKKYDSDLIYNILQWKGLDGIRKQLIAEPHKNGRIYASYNAVGTDTGRLTCYKSNNDTGYNLQTVTKKNRKFFLGDEGYYWFQCDLSGADTWTVASRCAELGDPTMLNDILHGIKPAQVVAALWKHGRDIATLPPAEMLEICKQVRAELEESGDWAWKYFASKRVVHGSNYGLGPRTMSTQILADSWKFIGEPVFLKETDCKALQRLYMDTRYHGVHVWQAWIKRTVAQKRRLESASGHTRKFLSAKVSRTGDLDNATFQAALSHEPQANTTYATNLALSKMWGDPENRINGGRELIIQPLHHVHDAVCGQFPIDREEWSVGKIRSYFDNPLIIGGQEVNIPYEGEYGRSWGEMDKGVI